MSKIGIDESEKLCWKHEIFPCQKLKKGWYIRCYVSASQYKSVENTDMYVRIVASWLQFIYILWVFYVIILSIFHHFIGSSISGGFPSTTSGTVVGAIPQVSGRPVGQIQGRSARHWLEPVGGGRSVEVHCRRRWRATSEPSRVVGAAKEGERGVQVKGRWGGSGKFARG